MTYAAIVNRIANNAATGTGVRLSPDDTDRLDTLLNLVEAINMADQLDEDEANDA